MGVEVSLLEAGSHSSHQPTLSKHWRIANFDIRYFVN